MEYDSKTLPAAYMTSDKTSFAYVSATDRWPVILVSGTCHKYSGKHVDERWQTGAIDDVHRATTATEDEEAQKEGKWIVEELAKLKHELQHDRNLSIILADGHQDVAGYNQELGQLGHPTWFNVPWLYAECYLYRKWKNYDVFARQKMSTFKSSRPAVLELAAKYKELVLQLEKHVASERSPGEIREAEELMFSEMCEICLWGNATDLSLLTALTYEDIQQLQGSAARKQAEKNIVVNDLSKAYEVLSAARNTAGSATRRVDIVLDNAGFELFVDLILAGYLLSANLATTVVLHPKSIPWFVSDVLPGDFAALLNVLADPQSFYAALSDEDKLSGRLPQPLTEKEIGELLFLFRDWSSLHQEGRLIIRPNRFWTQAGSYWRLPQTESSLYEDLKESELVIFKGDLNYRKLTGDAMWDPVTPFTDAIGPLGLNSGIRTLALRTCKADVIVGLPHGENERLMATDGGSDENGARKWAWSGKWAVVQFCDGK
ncbi:MAG: hypothetical protein M1837_001814 [Sclerophora amabilis]|nr:MAG: hypothetical protein M1837_001814 [Sclerophora amabilis]